MYLSYLTCTNTPSPDAAVSFFSFLLCVYMYTVTLNVSAIYFFDSVIFLLYRFELRYDFVFFMISGSLAIGFASKNYYR